MTEFETALINHGPQVTISDGSVQGNTAGRACIPAQNVKYGKISPKIGPCQSDKPEAEGLVDGLLAADRHQPHVHIIDNRGVHHRTTFILKRFKKAARTAPHKTIWIASHTTRSGHAYEIHNMCDEQAGKTCQEPPAPCF